MISKVTRLWHLLFHIYCIIQVAEGVSQFQLSTLQVSNNMVSTSTSLLFMLTINRETGTKVQDGDYLEFDIPTDTSAKWDTTVTNVPKCTIQNGGQALACKVITEKKCRITLGSQQNLVIKGMISNFINPLSIKQVSGIQATLFKSTNEKEAIASGLTLSIFQPSILQVQLSSSSKVVGLQNVVLAVEVTPSTYFTQQATMILSVPEYYPGANQNVMFQATDPDPCSVSGAELVSCQWRRRQQQIKITFRMPTPSKDTITFSVGNFKNPITESHGGFGVVVVDNEEYPIAQTTDDVVLSGISAANVFQSVAFNYLSTAASGQDADHQFIFKSSMPIQKGCLLKIQYPPEYKITAKLDSIDVSGFLESVGGGAPQFTISPQDNSIEIVACKKNYGAQDSATLVLSTVRNQEYVNEGSGPFLIQMTEELDKTFSRYYLEETNLRVKKEQQRAGEMKGSITAAEDLVQTFTHFQIKLEPSMNLRGETAYMVINVPKALRFQGPSCSITDIKGDLNPDMQCTRRNNQLTLMNPFKPGLYEADKSEVLYFQLHEFLLPDGVQNVGTVQVIMRDERDGDYRDIDLLEYKNMTTRAGTVTKLSEVAVGTKTTSLQDQTYTFHFKLQHQVPLGGQFRIVLSEDFANGVRISSEDIVKQNCYIISESGERKGLACSPGYFQGPHGRRPYVDVECTRNVFGEDGTAKGDSFKFEIKGLTNPRLLNYVSFFSIYSVDTEGRYIDTNFSDQKFDVTMTELLGLVSVAVSAKDKRNGASTQYQIQIVSKTLINSNDIFKIQFPDEVRIPANVTCTTGSPTVVPKLTCQRIKEHTVQFVLTDVLSDSNTQDLIAGVLVKLNVENIINPPSLKTSGSFSNMILTDSGTGLDISEYTKPVTVTNQYVGQLDRLKADIKQTSLQPEEETEVELDFYTNNPLAKESCIVVAVPQTLPKLLHDPDSCYARVNGVPIKGICKFVSLYQINYIGALANFDEPWHGRIQLFFKVQNPADNLEIDTEAYEINIYNDANMTYGVDRLKDALYPAIGCDYPCNSCPKEDRRYCQSCLPPKEDYTIQPPQFLLYHGLSKQTCEEKCPADQGYTSNGTRDPRKCTKCADTCKTCAQEDRIGDVSNCTQCDENFPYRWAEKASCHSTRCPKGSYEDSDFHCTSCPGTCKECADKTTCLKCDGKSSEQYLRADGACYSSCPDGTTPINGTCVPCEAPCYTCDVGQVNSCLSCDNEFGRWVRYGRSCLQNCPINTTVSLDARVCMGCKPGCQLCDDRNRTLCLRCSEGLALLENKCFAVCPFSYNGDQYRKSPDGTACEVRDNPLDRTFVAFPILGTAMFFVLITLASYWLTAHRSIISSTLIAIFGPIEMAAALYQFIYTLGKDRKYVPIQIGSICAFVAALVLNAFFIVNFKKVVMSNTDREFERWRRDKKYSSTFFLALAGFPCLTLYRLIYCRLFRIDMMSIKVTRPLPFLKPLFMFTWIKFLVFNIPLIVVDIVGISNLEWGSQVYMTCMESMILSFLSFFLMVYEHREKDGLILREAKAINLDKMDRMDEKNRKDSYVTASSGSPVKAMRKPSFRVGLLPGKFGDLGGGKNQINLQGVDFQMSAQKSGENYGGGQDGFLEQRDLEVRVNQLSQIVMLIRQNKAVNLNGRVDNLILVKPEEIVTPRPQEQSHKIYRSKSMQDLGNNNDLNETDSSIKSQERADSWPVMKINCEEKMKAIHDHIDSINNAEFDRLNKPEAFSDVDSNLYKKPEDSSIADSKEGPQLSGDEDKGEDAEAVHLQSIDEEEQPAVDVGLQRIKNELKWKVVEQMQKAKEDRKKERRRKQFRKGKKSFLINAIDEEDDKESNKSDKFAQNQLLTSPYDSSRNKVIDMFTLAMQVEKRQSLTSLYELEMNERSRIVEQRQALGQLGLDEHLREEIQQSFDNKNLRDSKASIRSSPNMEIKGIELSRVSGDLEFSEESEDSDKVFDDPHAKHEAERVKRENVQAWIKDQTDKINQRNFNYNGIVGDFLRDYHGDIVDREYTLQLNDHHDRRGNLVNEKGYLIDSETRNVRSRYTFDTVFENHELIGVDGNRVELPLPYRIEKYNFNPHECYGNFDYDEREQPIVLKDPEGNKIDRNLRLVNASGWLIDKKYNIINNLGQVIFLKEQLLPKGEIPNLYNFEGVEYSIKSVMGLFERHLHSKEIILGHTSQNRFTSCDLRQRKVNSKGYLLDKPGNIIDKSGKIIWRSHELMYNEPMKIFPFTEFSINWIMGNLDRDVTLNPKHDDEFDLGGRQINTMGYLIDHLDNVIDSFGGNVLFKRDILSSKWGMEAEIPYVFRSGQLRQPEMDIIEYQFELQKQRHGQPRRHLSKDNMDLDSKCESSQNQARNNPFKHLAPLKDIFGRAIEDIPMSRDLTALMDEDGEFTIKNDDQSSYAANETEGLIHGMTTTQAFQQNNRPMTGTHKSSRPHLRPLAAFPSAASAFGAHRKTKEGGLQGNYSMTQLPPLHKNNYLE